MQTESPKQVLSLAAVLQSVLQIKEGEQQTIGNVCTEVGEKGFGVLLVMLSLPSALPIPAPGYSTPFGLAILLVAFQILRGQEKLWLPSRIQKVEISSVMGLRMASVAGKFLGATERWIKPRHKWITSTAGQVGLASIVALMAILMLFPIPLTNTFPAMVIFLIGIALAEEDGLLAFVAFVIGALAVMLYTYMIYLAITQGPEAVDLLIDWIKGFTRP